MSTAPDRRKTASKRRRRASPSARRAREKHAWRAQAHEQCCEHASEWRTQRASACHTARTAAYARQLAHGRPGSSMTVVAAINGVRCAKKAALAVLGGSARGCEDARHLPAAQRCAQIKSLVPARCGSAHPCCATALHCACLADWTRREAHSTSVSSRRSEAALTAYRPRASASHEA